MNQRERTMLFNVEQAEVKAASCVSEMQTTTSILEAISLCPMPAISRTCSDKFT